VVPAVAVIIAVLAVPVVLAVVAVTVFVVATVVTVIMTSVVPVQVAEVVRIVFRAAEVIQAVDRFDVARPETDAVIGLCPAGEGETR
jgi:hypothetical protein